MLAASAPSISIESDSSLEAVADAGAEPETEGESSSDDEFDSLTESEAEAEIEEDDDRNLSYSDWFNKIVSTNRKRKFFLSDSDYQLLIRCVGDPRYVDVLAEPKKSWVRQRMSRHLYSLQSVDGELRLFVDAKPIRTRRSKSKLKLEVVPISKIEEVIRRCHATK
jgi:hypothetical protein